MVATDGRPARMPRERGPAQKVLRVADLVQRQGLEFESRDDRLSAEAPLLTGEFWHRELRRGLYVHASDVFEEADFTALSAQHAGLSCVFFLQGNVDVEIGGRGFHFEGLGSLREGLAISSARPESFRRMSLGRQRIRHLVVSVTPDWLDRDGLASAGDHRLALRILREHLASRHWTTTARLNELVNRILAPGAVSSELGSLFVESAAVEIVAETLAALTHQDGAETNAALSAHDRGRLRRAEEFIVNRRDGRLSVEEIARAAGVSASGLQRLFRAAHGASVIEHIRSVRLEQAREALSSGELSIQEASSVAGYSSAANFATAYKRHFGETPKQVSRYPGR